ncbi:MAG: PhoX family protein [Parvibaculales bacterium]
MNKKSFFNNFDGDNYDSGRHSDFSRIVENGILRRDFLKDSAVLSIAGLASALLPGIARAAIQNVSKDLMSFSPVKANSLDTVTLPKGYSHDVLISWGDPLLPGGVPFDERTRGTAESQKLAFGDNNDGMEIFPISKKRALIAVNNESANLELILLTGKVQSRDDILKNKNAHGVSIFEIEQKGRGAGWKVVSNSRYNRRITPDTEMEITGVAKGSDLLKTSYDVRGRKARGTWTNCGAGKTPWGTYLTCEENFDEYFASSSSLVKISKEYHRYGIGKSDEGYSWYKEDSRFDISKEPNEPNRVGYVVEIDPENPNAAPRKLTSLGRFKHENAELVISKEGHIVVYMGDDEEGEHLYKFVSKKKYNPALKKKNSRLLNEGTLYVAKFGKSDGRLSGKGEWIALLYGKNGLTRKNGFENQAYIQVFARKAATFVNATTMDRPESVAAHPHNSSVYCSLSKNKNRGKKKNAGGVEQLVNGPNPRKGNNYGQIIRWIPDNDDHADGKFSWNLFVVAGNPLVKKGLYRGTANINPDNMFNAPDGLQFDNDGRLWIQTDGQYSNKGDFEGMGNNQMLCADPLSRKIKRFLVGPIACEITGLAFSDDGKQMFVGIQHPGEDKQPSTFPYGGVPRSSVIVIYKDDGGIIGT